MYETTQQTQLLVANIDFFRLKSVYYDSWCFLQVVTSSLLVIRFSGGVVKLQKLGSFSYAQKKFARHYRQSFLLTGNRRPLQVGWIVGEWRQ